MPFMASSLAFALTYIWARRNPSIKMSLFGVITYVALSPLPSLRHIGQVCLGCGSRADMGVCRITAPYLPLCLVAFSWLLQGGFDAAIGDIVSLFSPKSTSVMAAPSRVGVVVVDVAAAVTVADRYTKDWDIGRTYVCVFTRLLAQGNVVNDWSRRDKDT